MTKSSDTAVSGDEALLRDLASAMIAVQRGELKVRLPRRVGMAGEVSDLFNELVVMLEKRNRDLLRISRVVGREGRMLERLDEDAVDGSWAEATHSVNSLIDDLARPTAEIARVLAAVAEGDLSEHMALEIEGRPLRGEFLRIGRTVNKMVNQLSSFADEVTRVAREVGTEGKLGAQAQVKDVAGTWRDLTDNVNQLADNLTRQVRNIAQVTTAVARGDLSQKITVDARGEILELKSTVNTMVDQLSSFADEVTRVAREVGTEGKLGGQAHVSDVAGTWRDLTDNVNYMASNLTGQVRNIAQVTTAVARGDLSQKITADARGEILELKSTVNTMVDQLSSFADEVTRVAREVGTEGKLGGQAEVKDVAGTWRDLTENVNQLADNLTGQVRNIAQVTTAVAKGDLSQKITVDARGEMLELKSTVNTMVDQLSSFADEVTRVAREVGTEGKLGGQAEVKDVAGTWRDLTENVNQLASTLTSQLRAISVVSTAVARGDLTQQIQIAAMGEVAALRDNINQMILTLRETTKENAEQGWLDSNLARISALLQGQRDLTEVSKLIMNEAAPLVNAQVGAFFLPANPVTTDQSDSGKDDPMREVWQMSAGYALNPQATPRGFRVGEGLVGQAAATKQVVLVTHIPADYLPIGSGLGTISPTAIVVLPVLFEGESLGVIEFGSVSTFPQLHLTFLERLAGTLGVTIASIQANSRTEELLGQSQRLAVELQYQSAELQRTNAELEEKAALLFEQNRNIEIKNMEIDAARRGVEENAQQLARASQYKSEFLANMSHELRTPLNSLLLLSRLLADNEERNLTSKQKEFATTIHNAGSELLLLIDDILDLSKIEAGRVDLDPQPVALAQVRAYVEQAFVPQAEDKGLELRVHIAPELPSTVSTDAQRLQQILRNLLSNAIKFTAEGEVTLSVGPASQGDAPFGVPELDAARTVLAFTVRDTGIGIVTDKLDMIFEAFQQADGTTSRKYGGTGLGLSISKELAQMLGGVITVTSEIGTGSVFTLYLPDELVTSTVTPTNKVPRRAPEPSEILGEPTANGRGPILRSHSGPPRVDRPVTDLTGVTVLIVDDDVRNVFALTSALELHGLTVLYADNGADGIQLLTEHPEVDIVLMDAMMPEMDGNATTKLIRGLPGGADLPVVFLTAKAMPGDRESSLAAGATDYVTKPVDKELLLSVMASWISRARTAGVRPS
ncbi:HAMP domain-containing protein [Pseudonocardia spinosispora]|uniref:HAMP domain-containing protein n=1 Tax=Pseudonocardia spinosispora TaxID=103441 RepID=UPI00048E4FBA|nr:HAMP domain-containing protein [Pseudonocardia spinosispora]